MATGNDEYLFDSVKTPLIVIIFLFAAFGITTCSVEHHRLANWKSAMGWLPGKDTWIYPLDAGEVSDRQFFSSRCYRVRSYPPDNQIKTLIADQKGYLYLIDPDCNTDQCPVRYFQLEKSGYLFIEKELTGPSGKCNHIVAGWAPSELRPGSNEQNAAVEREREEREAAERIARETRALEASFDKYSKWLSGDQILVVSRKRECFADNIRETDSQAFMDIARMRRGDEWVYGSVTIPGNVHAIFFDSNGLECTEALSRIQGRGYLNDWAKLNAAMRWSEAPNAPSGLRKMIEEARQSKNRQNTKRPADGFDNRSGNSSQGKPETNRSDRVPSAPSTDSAAQNQSKYTPPPGWKIDDGKCTRNIQYIPEIEGFICEL